jgi:SAM-dependent methyltransferase
MAVPAHEDPARSRDERIAALGYDYAAQPKAPLAPCNLCGSDRWTLLTHVDRYGFPAQAGACWTCGLTALKPTLTPEGYHHFYSGVYRPLVSAFHGRRIDAVTIQDEQKVYAADMARFCQPFLEERRGGAFLDVGGSTGIVAAALARRFDLRATVIDPAPLEVEQARALGIETITGLVEEWDPGTRKFPVIGMFQTIDHLMDVGATLRKLRQLVADDGVFVVDIVDFRAAYLRAWRVETAVKVDHVFSLTESTTEALLARAGFAPVRKSYSGDHLHIVYVCRPGQPDPTALPSASAVAAFFAEVRLVQNAPRP